MADKADKSVRAGQTGSFFDSPTESFEAQYRAAMEGVVVLDRAHLKQVSATGSERTVFLHNMLSADIENLPELHGTKATFLTSKGKLVADLAVFHDGNRMLLEMESSRVGPLIEALSRYIISEDVTLEPIPNEESFSVEGPGASKLLGMIAAVPPEELDALPDLGVRSGEIRITSRKRDPSARFDVAATPTAAIELLDAAFEQGAIIGGSRLAETRRIEAGRPRFGVDMDESHMALEAGLDDAINFDKGCYIGQEYVVRLAHRGHLNRKLVGVRIDADTPPPRGAKLTSGETPAGELTSTAYSPTLGATVALGYVRRPFYEPDASVEVDGGLSGTVSKLPFV